MITCSCCGIHWGNWDGLGCTTAARSHPGASPLGSRKPERRKKHGFPPGGWEGGSPSLQRGPAGMWELQHLPAEFPSSWKRFSGTNPDLVLSCSALLCPGEQQGRGAGAGDRNLKPKCRDKPQILAFSSALDQGSAAPRRSRPISGVEELGQGSRREIYLWDSGKGWENLGEVLQPRSGVTPGSGIYLEQDNVSDRREKNKKIRGGGADPSPWLGVTG